MKATILVVNAASPVTINDVKSYDLYEGLIVLSCESGTKLISARQLISMSITDVKEGK